MQQISYSVIIAFNNLMRSYRIIRWLLIIVTLAVAVWRLCVYHSIDKNESRVLSLDTYKLLNQSLLVQKDNILRTIINKSMDPNTGSNNEYVIFVKDMLRSILNQYVINIRNISRLLKTDKDLCNLQISQQIYWSPTYDNQQQCLIWVIPHLDNRTYGQIGSNFKISNNLENSEWKNSVLTGVINSSFTSIQSMRLNNIIGISTKFNMLLLRKELDSEKERHQLLAINLDTNDKNYYIIRIKDGKSYDHNNTGLVRGFMRFPTGKQYRISSNFNLRRLNPVTGYISPHKGVDFAMPIGTPVLAVSDGEVMQAKYSVAAGNYVTIRHDRQYMTRYMHMKKLLVKPGDKVKLGDPIGLSGSTGRSSGPHLHYEIWIGNQAVNPLTAKLPRVEVLTSKDLSAFLA